MVDLAGSERGTVTENRGIRLMEGAKINTSLLALDNFVITDEERIEDASFGYRFRGLNEFMKLHIPDYSKEKSAE